MVKLRLRRMGKKKQPIYKVVAADARSPRDGKFLESVGVYNPLTNPHTIDLKEDRVNYWLNVGAQPTATVKSILSQQGILLKRDLTKRGLSEDKVSSKLEEWSNLKAAKTSKKVAKKEDKKAVVVETKAEVQETKSEADASSDTETA